MYSWEIRCRVVTVGFLCSFESSAGDTNLYQAAKCKSDQISLSIFLFQSCLAIKCLAHFSNIVRRYNYTLGIFWWTCSWLLYIFFPQPFLILLYKHNKHVRLAFSNWAREKSKKSNQNIRKYIINIPMMVSTCILLNVLLQLFSSAKRNCPRSLKLNKSSDSQQPTNKVLYLQMYKTKAPRVKLTIGLLIIFFGTIEIKNSIECNIQRFHC